jgi:hypothetical protein
VGVVPYIKIDNFFKKVHRKFISLVTYSVIIKIVAEVFRNLKFLRWE